MKSWLRFCMPLVLGVALFAAPVSTASAQSGDDALLVISVESIDDLLEHLDYLLEVGGVEEFGTVARMMTAPFTEVVDKTMPIGAVALVNGDDEIYPLVFVPVDDFEALLDVLEVVLEAELEEVGDDIYRVAMGGDSAYLKNEGDWVFVSNSEDALEDLPKNPEDYLGDLPQDYVVAIQANVQNIPEMYVDMAITQIRAGMAGAIAVIVGVPLLIDRLSIRGSVQMTGSHFLSGRRRRILCRRWRDIILRAVLTDCRGGVAVIRGRRRQQRCCSIRRLRARFATHEAEH